MNPYALTDEMRRRRELEKRGLETPEDIERLPENLAGTTQAIGRVTPPEMQRTAPPPRSFDMAMPPPSSEAFPMQEPQDPGFQQWVADQPYGRDRTLGTLDAIFSGLAGKGWDQDFWTGKDIAERDRQERYLQMQEGREGRAEEAAGRAARMSDPSSPESQAVQEMVRSQFPQAPEEVIRGITAADYSGGDAVKMLMQAQERARAAEAQAAERAYSEDWDNRRSQRDFEEARALRETGKRRGGGGGGGRALPAEGELSTEDIVRRTFERENMEPPEGLIQRARAARNRKEQAAVFKDMDRTVQRASEGYGKEARVRGLDIARSNLTNVERVLGKFGDGDIPGFGQTGMLPPQFLSAEGKEARRAIKELLDTKLRIATGAAAPPSEQQTFREILGVGALSTDEDLRKALAQVRFILNEQEGYVREMFSQTAPKSDPTGLDLEAL